MFLMGKWVPHNGVKIKQINQFSATECGIASLAMIMAYHQVHIPMEVLRERCGATRDGTSAATLIAVAESYGFEAAAYRVEIEDIAELTQPVIAHWCFQHYVVIRGMGNKKVFINDPAIGERSVSLEEFDQSFTGVIIHLQVTERVLAVDSPSVLPDMLNKWFRYHRYELACLLLCLLLAAIVPLVHAKLAAVVIDLGVIGKHQNLLTYLLVPVTTVGLISLVIYRIQNTIQFRITAKASLIKSSELMVHILRLPLLFFSLRQKSDIIAIMTRAESVAQTLFNGFSGIIIHMIAASVALVILFVIDAHLTLMLLLLISLLACSISVLVRINAVHEQSNLPRIGKYASHLLSAVKNREMINIGGIEAKMQASLQSLWNEKMNNQDKSNRIMLLMQVIVQQFNTLTMLFMLVLGVNRVAQGVLSPGAMMGFYGIQLYFTSQLASILGSIKGFQQAYVAELRINELQNSAIDMRFIEDQPHLDAGNDIVLTCINLGFHYNHAKAPVLTDIHFQIKQGQHIAFVGSTGSGKSTLVKILARLYQPTQGKICLYGNPCIAYVSQEIQLFSGTIYDNLTLWQSGVSDDVINSAIESAGLTKLIESRGIYGQVIEGGLNFSGGERQRLEIARALIQQPTLLVLDEATAALDAVTEKIVLDRIRALPMTVIHVAHRLETIAHCDQIFVLDQGQIVERGLHDGLIAAKSHYYHLANGEH